MRVGILGGTFDPIHYGHLKMAITVQTFFACDRLLILPAYSPPHKNRQAITSSYHRYAMAVLATSELDNIEVSRLELEAPARPFTVQTIACLKTIYGEKADLFFIMGGDSFRELDSWHQYQQLLNNCYIVVITRPGYTIDLAERRLRLRASIEDLRGKRTPIETITGNYKVFFTDLLELDISATTIRAAVAAGNSIEQWVPPTVVGYIKKYRLYQENNESAN